VKRFDCYFFLLPSGAGSLGDDAERLRAAAETAGQEGWLLGCRDERRPRRGDSARRSRRPRVSVLLLAVVGTPAGEIGVALAAAGALHGVVYVRTPPPAGSR
jgi:hypothetical protein